MNATGHIAGVFPHLAIGGHATLENGYVAGFPVSSADVTTRILGDRVSIDSAAADLGFVQFTATATSGSTRRRRSRCTSTRRLPDLGVGLTPRRPA